MNFTRVARVKISAQSRCMAVANVGGTGLCMQSPDTNIVTRAFLLLISKNLAHLGGNCLFRNKAAFRIGGLSDVLSKSRKLMAASTKKIMLSI